MDYNAIHGADVSSFNITPTRRQLPAVVAADVLDELDEQLDSSTGFVSTGLESLDNSLRNALPGNHDYYPVRGGIEKGLVTEVWGPPGAGKTALGIQLTANILCEGSGVVWVDCFHPVCNERLGAVVEIVQRQHGDVSDCMKGFIQYTCASLAHFIALLCRPTDGCIPPGTSLIVIDSLSALINHAFPKVPEPKASDGSKGNKGAPLTTRRRQMLQYLIKALQKLAATRDIAVVLLTQCATRLQTERGATLIPAINARDWDQGVSTRLVVYRDWIWDGHRWQSVHFARVQKSNSQGPNRAPGDTTPFAIDRDGLASVKRDTSRQPPVAPAMTPSRKRREIDFEVADSDDEEYGWQDEDADAVPPMPSQWQGSEDLLLGQPAESDEDERDQIDSNGADPELGEKG